MTLAKSFVSLLWSRFVFQNEDWITSSPSSVWLQNPMGIWDTFWNCTLTEAPGAGSGPGTRQSVSRYATIKSLSQSLLSPPRSQSHQSDQIARKPRPGLGHFCLE